MKKQFIFLACLLLFAAPLVASEFDYSGAFNHPVIPEHVFAEPEPPQLSGVASSDLRIPSNFQIIFGDTRTDDVTLRKTGPNTLTVQGNLQCTGATCGNGAGVLAVPITTPDPIPFDVGVMFKGRDPWADITRYGGRGLTSTAAIPAVSGITATTTSSSPTVTVSTSVCASQASSVCFVNGDGVAIANAGAAISMSTPAAPTVSPVNSVRGTGTNSTVAAPAHGTTYNYKVLGCDQAGGCTAASATGSTATGNASLGAQSLAITSATRTNDTLTFNTPSQPDIGVGAVGHADGFSVADNALGFGGWWKVATVTGTGFTATLVGLDTRSGAAAASFGGGTFNWWNGNHVAFACPAGAYFCVIQSDRQNPGTFVNIAMSWPINPGFTDGTTSVDDFGQTMMANNAISIPWYVPSNGSATNDLWVTTISAGAGTTTLTMAGNAPNSTAAKTIRYDLAPNIAAAATALGTSGKLKFPIGAGSFVTNSVLDLSGASPMLLFDGGLLANATIKTGAQARWQGQNKASTGQFQIQSNTTIAFGASPGLHIVNGNVGTFTGITFVGATGGIGIFQDGFGGEAGTHWDLDNFYGAGAASDYMSMAFVCRGDVGASCVGAMGSVFLQAGTQAHVNASFTPSMFLDNVGEFSIDFLMGSARPMAAFGVSAGGRLRIGRAHWQGGTAPLITVSNEGGMLIGLGDAGPVILDTMGHAAVAFVNNSNQAVSVVCASFGCDPPSSGLPAFTGAKLNSITGGGPGQGQNTASISGANFTDNTVSVSGIAGKMGYAFGLPPAPTVAISGGVGPAANTYYYQIYAVDSFPTGGGSGDLGTGISAQSPKSVSIAVNGSQGVLVSWTPITGQATTIVCRNTSPTAAALCADSGAGFRVAGNSFLDTGFTPTGFTLAPPNGLASGFTASGTETSLIVLTPTLFANLGTPGNGTFRYCPDCTNASNPCTSGGTGAQAKRLNGAWVC